MSKIGDGKYSERHLVEVAKKAVAKKTENTVVLDKEVEARIPRFGLNGTFRSRSIAFYRGVRLPTYMPHHLLYT
jgi:hypothetical protein